MAQNGRQTKLSFKSPWVVAQRMFPVARTSIFTVGIFNILRRFLTSSQFQFFIKPIQKVKAKVKVEGESTRESENSQEIVVGDCMGMGKYK